MTATVVVMILVGIAFILCSYFISEKITAKEDSVNVDLMAITKDYQFSERELQIIKTKIEDVIADQAKEILYETNDSLSSMANEKTIALGDYAVTVCDEIEKNHKEVMFLYSMLEDKQKDLMSNVKIVDATKDEIKELLKEYKEISIEKELELESKMEARQENIPAAKEKMASENNDFPKNSALEQLTSLKNAGEASGIKEEPVADEFEESLENTETIENFVDTEEDIFADIDQTNLDLDDVLEDEFENNDNSNDIILEMYRNGSNILDIAKQLGLGVGEVRLVIDLYQGE